MNKLKQGYKQTDIGMIPEDWEVETIGNFLVFKNGLNKAKEFFGYGTPIVNYMDVYSKDSLYSTDIKGKVYLSTSEILRYEVKTGDVFFTRTSETPEEVGISSVVLDCQKNTVFSGFILRGRPINNKLTNEFKTYCFQTKNVRSSIIQSCTYTTRALTNGTQLSKILIPIPTPEEQTAIATALSDTDALIAALDKKIAKKQQIKQGAMQQLLTGKKRLPGFSGEWVNMRLGDYTDISRGGSPRPIENYLTNDLKGVNWIKIGDVGVNAKYIESTDEKIIPEGVSRSRFVKKGDFLLSNSMSFGRPYILKIDGCIHDGWLVIQNYQNTYDTDYLYYMLGFESTLNQYKSVAAGSSVLNLNKQIVSNVFIFCPLKDEQTAIAQILTDMDHEIAQLEKEWDKYKELKSGMMQVLLTGKVRLV